MKKQVELYTDGACSGNPGPGGWGAILRCDKKEREISGGERQTTNNRMEMLAAISGLRELKYRCTVELYTDSKYLLQGATEWLSGWKAKGWLSASKKPVKNVDLWQQLDALLKQHEIHWHWVRGHSGHPENERADQLARAAIPWGKV